MDLKIRLWDEINKVMIKDRSDYLIEIDDGTVWENVGISNDMLIDKPYLVPSLYIGLKDITGKEIYIGDHIVVPPEKGVSQYCVVYEVKWGVYDIGVNDYEYRQSVVGPYVEEEYVYSMMIEGEILVIGNKYEKPELSTCEQWVTI